LEAADSSIAESVDFLPLVAPQVDPDSMAAGRLTLGLEWQPCVHQHHGRSSHVIVIISLLSAAAEVRHVEDDPLLAFQIFEPRTSSLEAHLGCIATN